MHTLESNGDHCKPHISKWQVGASTFQAAIEKGARLMTWDVELAQGSPRKVLHWPKEPDWTQAAKIRGGNPILFPFVARTFADGKENFWKHPNHKLYEMPRHGFSRDAMFETLAIRSDGFTARLKQLPQYANYFPFQYDFDVEYCFEELGFTVSLILHNRDHEPIPWCAGHHFYFTVPWHEGLEKKHYKVLIEAKKNFYVSPDGNLKAIKSPDLQANLASEEWIDRLHTHLKNPIVEISSHSPGDGFKVIFPELLPWSTLTTWTESTDSLFYCIEPWMGPPNATTHECGLHWVTPGTTEIFKIRVEM